jgi:hypothetical protein
MIDMNVFLAEKDGVKLAMKAALWREATEIMWNTPWDDIRNAMTAAGWTREEKGIACTVRRVVKESIDYFEKKEKEKQEIHKQILADRDMSVFLAVDANSVKLARRAAFWNAATPKMWAVPWEDIIKAMTAAGWTREEKGAAGHMRKQVKESIDKREEKEKDYQQTIAGIDMSVFLKVDLNGDKEVTTPNFWRNVTDDIWKLDPQHIWEFLRRNEYKQEDLDSILWTRRHVKQSIISNQEKDKIYQGIIADKDMSVFLVTENGVKLATTGKFWKKATLDMWSIPTEALWWFLDKNGWTAKEISKTRCARYYQTPEGKESRKTQEARGKINEQKRERYANDPEYRLTKILRNTVRNAFDFLQNEDPTDEQLEYYNKRTMEIVGCTFNEFKDHISSKFKPGTSLADMGIHNPETHATNPTYELDHRFPIRIAQKNKKNIAGLNEFLNNYKNLSPLDAKFNHLKYDHIILECISPECPGYPFADGLIGVERIFKTIDEFIVFKGYNNRSDFPLL